MKADFSNWNHKPENHVILKAYAENALLEGATRGIVPVVVWRDGEATLTLTPQEGEQIYDFGIVDRRVVEIPEEVLEALENCDKNIEVLDKVVFKPLDSLFLSFSLINCSLNCSLNYSYVIVIPL
jgi:hypothetical protein